MSENKLLRRIGGLLRQAESTDNEHEAEAFMLAAQQLAAQASIDLAVARAHIADRERRPMPTHRAIRIGEPGKRGLKTYVQLFVAIALANDLRCDVASNSTMVFAHGFDTDIDTCEALYTSLVVQMVRASDAYLKSPEHRRPLDGSPPVATVTARLNFQRAFAERIGIRFAEIQAATRAAAVTDVPDSTGTALALREKDLELTDFYTRHSTARGTWRGGSAVYGHAPGATRAGDRAARSARLYNATELGGSSRQITS